MSEKNHARVLVSADWQNPVKERKEFMEPAPSDWLDPLIQFLTQNIPGSKATGWEHQFLTAYQIGCEALVALGQANETSVGAMPRTKPTLPVVLPRWDDLSVAAIFLAAQNRSVIFLSAELGFRAASISPEVALLLKCLGLINGNQWTPAAETILWRDNPIEWRTDFTHDDRFLRAVEDACETMPVEIRASIERLAHVTADDVALHQHGLNGRTETIEQVRDRILWIRRHEWTELFYKHWRLEGGWLSDDQAESALEIFNDALAIAVNRRRNGTPYRLPKGTPASSCIGSARVGPGLSI